jgi:hypothetical protein
MRIHRESVAVMANVPSGCTTYKRNQMYTENDSIDNEAHNFIDRRDVQLADLQWGLECMHLSPAKSGGGSVRKRGTPGRNEEEEEVDLEMYRRVVRKALKVQDNGISLRLKAAQKVIQKRIDNEARKKEEDASKQYQSQIDADRRMFERYSSRHDARL